jgi:hypothetical protein
MTGYVLLSRPCEMDWPHMASPYSEIFPAATRGGANVARIIDGEEPPQLLMTVDADSIAGMRDVYHPATFLRLGEPGSAVRKDLAALIASASAS